MNFKEAYEEMLKGKKVRRPGWTSYWFIKDNKVFVKNIGCSSLKKKFSQVDIGYTATDDWEVVEESKTWEPKEREPYYYVENNGETLGDCNSNHQVDKDRICLGNCFKTQEEAKHMVEKLKVINELKKFALENNEAEIDWENRRQTKYLITYDYVCKELEIAYYYYTQYLPFNIYFTSREITQKAIETIGEDRIKKYYFDVED